MIIHRGYENLNLSNPVVTIGTFDGVHLGHRALLSELVSEARRYTGDSVVVTFNPHPRLVIDRESSVPVTFLSTFKEKRKLLEQSGVDHLIIVEFDDFIINLRACDFIESILVKKVGIRHLLVGYDHHFGRGREGNFDIISDCAAKFGFTVSQVPEVLYGSENISSSAIREALLEGMLDKANSFLGYSYSMVGKVVEGKRIGRALGYPTANIETIDRYKLIPANGVYAVEIEIDNVVKKGMLSIGTNPTVNEDLFVRSVEVHIFDFSTDLYGREIKVIFRYRLRNEKKFATLSQLSRQMTLDKDEALRLLGEQPH
jgi:riboflavin kinase/FMN adenylyltransferase